MPITAKLRYLRIAPRKVRLVADLIRGRSVGEAENILSFTTKKASLPLLKLLKSAVANAKNNFQLAKENLYISQILVDEGPKLKRWMARARGRADEIQKKTSHITLCLDVFKKSGIGGEGKIVRKAKEVAKIKKIAKPKLKPETKIPRPKREIGRKKIFRRMSF
jgi:large subunit ribosomal protein L22